MSILIDLSMQNMPGTLDIASTRRTHEQSLYATILPELYARDLVHEEPAPPDQLRGGNRDICYQLIASHS